MVELLIVVAIGGIIAAIAVPSLRETLRTTRQGSALSLLITDLNLARGEAIKRNSRVLVCVRNTAGSPGGANYCDAGADWRQGWVVCSEGATPNQCAATSTTNPNPMVVRDAMDTSLTLTAADAAGAATGVIRFNANSSQGSGGGAITLSLGGTWSGATTRTVQVQGTGYISRQ